MRPNSLLLVGAESAERLVVALGGNAIAGERGADPQSQQEAVEGACEQIAELVVHGHEVVITHGNGPQVGNLLLKNDLARHVVPPVPLDWCVAQTQATLGFLIVTALEAALRRRGHERVVSTVITRVLVAADDPAWQRPTKPIGRFVPAAEAADRIAAGEAWEERGERGWRRVVRVARAARDPRPRRRSRRSSTTARSSWPRAAAGSRWCARTGRCAASRPCSTRTSRRAARAHGRGGLLPDRHRRRGRRDRLRHRRARSGSAPSRPTGCATCHARGEFAGGSMGPKVRAALSFADGGGRAVITSLERLREGVEGSVGTRVPA